MYDDFKVPNYPNSLVSPEAFARHLKGLWTGEVIEGLQVGAGSGMQVTVSAGNAFIPYSAETATARLVSLVSTFSLNVPAADPGNPRIDYVILYVDNSVELPVVDEENPPTEANIDGTGVAKAIIVSGTPASTPSPPTVSQIQAAITSSNPYIILAEVRVNAGVSVISGGDITDARNMVRVISRGVTLESINGGTDAGLLATDANGVVTPKPRSVFLNVNLNTTTGTQEVTGIGFRPRVIRTYSRASSLSAALIAHGYAIDTGSIIQQGCAGSRVAGSATTSGNSSNEAFYHISGGASALIRAAVTAFTDDGFILNNTNTVSTSAERIWFIEAEA